MTRLLLAGIGLAAAIQCSFAWAGETLSGRPLILDGDTLLIRGKAVGLYGIAAPGPKQTCLDATGATIECGRTAARSLAGRVGEASIVCEPKGLDRGRPVAICRLGEEDLAAWMVSNGLAVADRLVAPDYVPQDTKAWAKRKGLWAGVFEDPTERIREDVSTTIKLTSLGR